MPLVDADVLKDRAPLRAYIAGKWREAKAVEAVLTGGGLDYCVEAERFERLILGLIRREYDGIAFHVPASDLERARALLRDAGLTAGLEDVEW